MSDPYSVSGQSLRASTAEWLADLNSGGGRMRGLLDDAAAQNSYFLAAAFLMANIGPQAVEDAATDQELLLFAVLATYQDDKFPGAGDAFDSFDDHVARAFRHFHEIGEVEAARRLRRKVVKQSEPGPEAFEEMMRDSRARNPAKSAFYERETARVVHRELRAADLLDPAGDFDRELLDGS